jgi:hypothetical protein
MKVSKVKSGKSASSVSRKKVEQGHGGEFAEHLKGAVASSEMSGTTEAAAVGAVDSILAVQESNDPTQQRGRRQSIQYGGELLDTLEDLRRDLLLGAIEKDKLGSLAQKMRGHRRQTDDPKLNQIIDEIEMRAEVEIAKLTRQA